MADEIVLLDGRWRKKGWVEAFRLRIFGSLPIDLLENAVRLGVVEKTTLNGSEVCLTDYGHSITDLSEISFSSENMQAFALVLHVQGYEKDWKTADSSIGASFLTAKELFPANFIAAQIKYLDEIFESEGD